MTARINIVLAQLNPHVGDVSGNIQRIIRAVADARKLGAQLVVFPELSVTGYPPEDLLFREDFIIRAHKAIDHLVVRLPAEVTVVVGYPRKVGEALYNSAVVLRQGMIVTHYNKWLLPNYGVFDEKRYFLPGNNPCVIEANGCPIGITICEDAWEFGPVEAAVAAGARIVVSLNASPYTRGKSAVRQRQVLAARARSCRCPIIYVNQVGGQDELVFDGGSFTVNSAGLVVQRSPQFQEHLARIECSLTTTGVVHCTGKVVAEQNDIVTVYQALTLGLGDYIHKNGFPGALVGLSGGIDSALTLAIAADALGADCVEAILMPSRYTRQMSIDDALFEAKTLGIKPHLLEIEPSFRALMGTLQPVFGQVKADTTEENIQARIRGLMLMAISNKCGKMVVTTGNKSEMAVGYATLYGDMVGGFAVLKDVPKTLVYQLAKYRNSQSEVIPQRVIERPPSAELAPDQLDEDSLPPYPELDAVLERYIELEWCVDKIESDGYTRSMIERVVDLVDRNEYKRRQAAPGVRISGRAFGRDRRYPLTWARYHR
ncbi:MAG TPA: NAD+ synthase [Gammaproteobacteria bacterium]|nr:NAD+ synthase [Gammaproteobacteria bacterium]